MSVTALFRDRQPAVPVRGVHLDLKGTPPTADRLVALLDIFAAARLNAVLVEWEDTFPWTVDVRFRGRPPYTAAEIRRFAAAAAERKIELIPLVQCLGHLETPLTIPDYEPLREVAHRTDVLNPLAPGARELIQAMVDDVLAVLPDVKRFHLGGDEAWSFGTHPDTAAYIAEHGKGALYLHHVEPILDSLNGRGVRPILWHDMMKDWESEALDHLRDKADLCVWGYQGHPDTTSHHFSSQVIERFVAHNLTLWGGTAYKGADGHNVDLPVIANRQANALAWCEVAGRYGFQGVFATGWSRYSTHDVQCEPIDGALDSLLNVAVILHDGRPPAGGIEACREALDTLAEGICWRPCYDALLALSAARERGWTCIGQLREWVTMATLDGHRRWSGIGTLRLNWLADAVLAAEAAAGQVRATLSGLMQPVAVEEYLVARVAPLREALEQLEARVRLLDPAGYAARER